MVVKPTNKLEEFIVDFQKKAMIHGSKHAVTGEHMPRGWHSDTIIDACVKHYGYDKEDAMGKEIAIDAKAFMVKQIESK
tara:strand:- start:328 stop:564 length:237 start_codon:yes stop_codon:yes gene_type:complete